MQPPKKRYNLRKRKNNKNEKINNDSDTDSDSDSDYVPFSESSNDEWEKEDKIMAEQKEEKNFKLREFQKFVSKIFPSKASEKRIKQLEKIDEELEKRGKKNKKKIKNKEEKENYEKEEEDTDEEYDEESDEYDEEYDEEYIQPVKGENINIILTLDGRPLIVNEDEYYDDDYADDEEEEEEEEEEITYKKGDKVMVKCEGWKKAKKGVIKKVRTNTCRIKCDGKIIKKLEWKYIYPLEDDENNEDEKIFNEMKELMELKKQKGDTAMIKRFDEMIQVKKKKDEEKRKKLEKKEKDENMKKFKKILNNHNVSNDFKYYRNLSLEKQTYILKQMEEINKTSNVEKPYRLSLLETDMPLKFKSSAMKKINTLTYMDKCSGEYYKLKQWVDIFMQIPFGKYSSLPLTIKDGVEKCNEFMEQAKNTLDNCVYGLNDAKMQIIQMIGQCIINPNSIGTAIAIHGPMGTGKTTLIRDGISKILNRPFAFLALGGATDSSFLEGHSYTYEGSIWGKIVDVLIQNKSMNPVFYFDELDKVSNTPKGEEIIGILTHLTDTTQNSQFHDKYFSNIDFDLSKALFIFSYNDETKINPILKDRMYCIKTEGYDKKDKTVIAKKYLIPAIEKNINFEKGQIIIPDETLHLIIDKLTQKEKGVRNLKRCLEIIYTKLNLFRLMKPESKLFDKKTLSLNVTFPFTVEKEMIDKLIKKYDKQDVPEGMYL